MVNRAIPDAFWSEGMGRNVCGGTGGLALNSVTFGFAFAEVIRSATALAFEPFLGGRRDLSLAHHGLVVTCRCQTPMEGNLVGAWTPTVPHPVPEVPQRLPRQTLRRPDAVHGRRLLLGKWGARASPSRKQAERRVVGENPIVRTGSED